MYSFTKVLSFLFLLTVAGVSGAAFLAPNARRQVGFVSNTQLEFGFLKELGLEKPDWLPDFGGKKEEKKEEPVAVADGEGEGEAEPESEGEGSE